MSDRDEFIVMIDSLLKAMEASGDSPTINKKDIHFNDFVKRYCETLIVRKRAQEDTMQVRISPFTENGLKILVFMRDNWKLYNNSFSAKTIGDEIFMTPRSVSGAIRKLVVDGFVEKTGTNPIVYSVTKEGLAYDLSREL